MRLIVDETAWRDLNDIGNWIGKESPTTARKVLIRILEIIEQLQDFPHLSRPGRARGTFERVISGTPYIVVFEIAQAAATLVVTAVLHSARNR